MNIFAKKGHKVKLAKSKCCGTAHDLQLISQHLQWDKVYTVERTVIDAFITDVYLAECPDVAFNSVMFDDCLHELN